MSGPLRADEAFDGRTNDEVDAIEVSDSREAVVGSLTVRRALPRRQRRTVGPWCFADHMGPATIGDADAGIGSHPHIGLQTVTWLVEGELLHRDSLGSEQSIRPGQLNLMSAGHGIVHAEENLRSHRVLHGIQLWVAQPERTRNGEPEFEHHDELPRVGIGLAEATVLVGDFAGVSSSARRDTDHVGVQLALRAGSTEVPVRPADEHAIVVLEGALAVVGRPVTVGQLCYVPPGRDTIELAADGPSLAMLLGGPPFESPIVMWWNFVARSKEEIDVAAADWEAVSERGGPTGSTLPRIPAPARPW